MMLGVEPLQFMGYTLTPALRLSAAVLLGSVAPLPVCLGAMLLADDALGGGSLLALLVVAQTIAMAVIVVIGLPLHAILVTLRLRGAVCYTLAGFAVAFAFAWFARPFGDAMAAGLIGQAGFAGLCGACVGWVFWKVAMCTK